MNPARMLLPWVTILVFSLLLSKAKGNKAVIKIGGIFQEDHYDAQMAFKYAIIKANTFSNKVTIEPIIHTVTSSNSIETSEKVCELAAENVIAIFGPESNEPDGIVESICQSLRVPNIQTSWLPDRPYDGSSNYTSINLYPNQQTLSEGIKAVIEDYGWKSYIILYENDLGLFRLQEVLQMRGHTRHVRQIIPGEDNRPLLKELKATGETRFIMDAASKNILDYLKQANELKLMGDQQSYFFTSLDAHTINKTELNKFSQSNITCMRMVDPTSHELKKTVEDWKHQEMKEIPPESVRLSAALMNDAVILFSNTLERINNFETANQSLSCEDPTTWQDGLGYEIFNKMLQMQSIGLTGLVKFDTNGKRKEFILDIVEFSRNGFNKIALWTSESNTVKQTRSDDEVTSIRSKKLQKKTFVITSKIGAPFLMFKEPEEGEVLTGNSRFEGYSMDLIDEISKRLNFNYRFQLVLDKKYGAYNNRTKKWNGMIREILDGKADFGICDMTITSERRKVVDFTMPFMSLGISILFVKQSVQPSNIFTFLAPFSFNVWIHIATAYLGVSLLLFVLARLVSKEWKNPHPCNEDCNELENSFSLQNSMWMTMGTFLQQGSDIFPKAVSTRMLVGMWWFFTLIMVSSYTANLTAFLISERMTSTIGNVHDLAKQSKVTYGAVWGGATSNFFKESNFSTYKRMWEVMETTRPSVFVKSNDEGVDRVLKRKGHYAFLMESSSLEYVAERHCELTQIGSQLDLKAYGIAMPLNSIYRTAIGGAVLKMQEEGKLFSLKKKWWKNMHRGPSCSNDTRTAGMLTDELGMDTLGGPFILLGYGCAIAFLLAIIEFFWNVQKVAVKNKISLRDALRSEYRFAKNVGVTIKPVISNSSPEGSTQRFPLESLEPKIFQGPSNS